MKKIAMLSLFSLCFLNAHSSKAAIEDKAIYGNDDRVEVYQSRNKVIVEATKSVAAQIYNLSIEENELKEFIYTYIGYGEKYLGSPLQKLCKDEKYLNQPAGANCTGFLIAEDKILTAGHCVTFNSDCEDFYWVFDLKYNSREDTKKDSFKFSSEQLVRCTHIEKRVYQGNEGLDYSIVVLDRKIKNRPILKLRESGKVSDDATLSVVGFPGSLPMKITSNAKVRDNKDDDVFMINSDTFHGNSGSPVMDQKTGLVEGILVRGETDYISNSKKDCRALNRLKENEGRGEDVIRIMSIMNDN